MGVWVCVGVGVGVGAFRSAWSPPVTTIVVVDRFKDCLLPDMYPSDDETFLKFPSRRSVVHSTKGIVSTTSPLATEAGLQILRHGGNAAVSHYLPRYLGYLDMILSCS